MALESAEGDGYIELQFGPRWKYIAIVRGFIQNFLAVVCSDGARVDRIAMAASELLENAVKYAAGEEPRVKVGLCAKTGDVDISVANKASPEAIAGLAAIWDGVMVGDPLEAYVRIRYETGGVMSLKVVNFDLRQLAFLNSSGIKAIAVSERIRSVNAGLSSEKEALVAVAGELQGVMLANEVVRTVSGLCAQKSVEELELLKSMEEKADGAVRGLDASAARERGVAVVAKLRGIADLTK